MVYRCFFFFSSRRRHTRCSRDWSSDVCSSDLYPFEHQADFKAHFPADFICEGVDQTRGWFYSLLAIAVGAFDAPAYKNVIVNELVLDAQGQKIDRKSTRLNSSHGYISYAVFCL